MGGMIATMLAAQHPQRVHTLTLISATAGRWQSLPTSWAAIKYAWQVLPPLHADYLGKAACQCVLSESPDIIMFHHAQDLI